MLDTTESGGELAVRLAIGETQIISDNKTYLAEHGIDISVLESATSSEKATKRSNNTILIKNLPHDTNAEELESMFSRSVVAIMYYDIILIY